MEPLSSHTNNHPMAVFVDWENVAISIRKNLGEQPNVSALKDWLDGVGRVVEARSYADWTDHGKAAKVLYRYGFTPIYVPTHKYGKGQNSKEFEKNAVDIHLAVEAMQVANNSSFIEHFVIMAGDGGYLSLISHLKSMGKKVTLVGPPGATSSLLANAADQYLPYEDLLSSVTDDEPQEKKTKEASASSREKNKRRAFEVLARIVKDLSKARPDAPPPAASLKPKLREKIEGFHEKKLGFSQFKKFLQAAEEEGYIWIETEGLTDRVLPPGKKVEEPAVEEEDVPAEKKDLDSKTRKQLSKTLSNIYSSDKHRWLSYQPLLRELARQWRTDGDSPVGNRLMRRWLDEQIEAGVLKKEKKETKSGKTISHYVMTE